MSYVSQIAGTGPYLPKKILSNQDLERMVDTKKEGILERRGMANGNMAAPDQAPPDLAYEAAIHAMKAAGVTADDIDGILVATVTGDQCMPSTACMLQARLGCKSIMAMD